MPTFPCRCVGVSFRGPFVKDYVSRDVSTGDPVELLRDPHNEYDPNAIKVYHGPNWIGFVNREAAEEIAPLLDSGRPYQARVTGWSSPILPNLEVKFEQETN